jgi:periplasmic divalent cation tolerance protein
MILVLVSFENIEDAKKIANLLIDKKLAACVSIMPATNFYSWKGKKVESLEIEAIIKTAENKLEEIKSEISSTLSYEIPQIISFNADANESYLKWLEEVTE